MSVVVWPLQNINKGHKKVWFISIYAQHRPASEVVSWGRFSSWPLKPADDVWAGVGKRQHAWRVRRRARWHALLITASLVVVKRRFAPSKVCQSQGQDQRRLRRDSQVCTTPLSKRCELLNYLTCLSTRSFKYKRHHLQETLIKILAKIRDKL